MNPIFSQILLEAGEAAGEDLEYTPAFAEFTALSTGRGERQVGDHIIPAQGPEWGAVFKAGCALLEQSRDLRILATVCQAALQQHGLPGLAQGLALMARWLESQWDTLHPALDIDGDYDPLFRSNAIASLSDPMGLVRALRQAVFLETPIGTVTISTAENLFNGKPAGEETIVSSLDQLSRIATEEKERNREHFAAIISIHSSLAAIASIFRERLEAEYWPDLELLAGIAARLERFVGATQEETAQEETAQPAPGIADAQEPALSAAASLASTPASAASHAFPPSIATRADAFKALALARTYFENNEPSHPAPLLIRRIERLANMDFLSLVEDLTPSGLQQLQVLAGESGD
ncbi:MAG: type VI secretion system protein TssA [Azoarcus sp.]|jgi:type VI secretion system protein ImpA|nr:type VI secretion system protein TssA [Azoarcus sp.]